MRSCRRWWLRWAKRSDCSARLCGLELDALRDAVGDDLFCPGAGEVRCVRADLDRFLATGADRFGADNAGDHWPDAAHRGSRVAVAGRGGDDRQHGDKRHNEGPEGRLQLPRTQLAERSCLSFVVSFQRHGGQHTSRSGGWYRHRGEQFAPIFRQLYVVVASPYRDGLAKSNGVDCSGWGRSPGCAGSSWPVTRKEASNKWNG